VLLSIAKLLGHHDRLIAGMKAIEESLAAARRAAREDDAGRTLGLLVEAHNRGVGLLADRKRAFDQLTATWEKSRYPKGREVDGRKFYHVFDDTKDHWADRRPDLTYMIAPEESIGLEDWAKQIEKLAQAFAARSNLAAPVF
jgi:hexosaminidase